MCTKSMKLKQKWCWSNDYSFFCVITWKLLFSGWGLTFGKGRIKICWGRISTREDFSSCGEGVGGQQFFDWWGKFTTSSSSPIPPVGKVLIFLDEYCICTTKLSFSNMIKLFNVSFLRGFYFIVYSKKTSNNYRHGSSLVMSL